MRARPRRATSASFRSEGATSPKTRWAKASWVSRSRLCSPVEAAPTFWASHAASKGASCRKRPTSPVPGTSPANAASQNTRPAGDEGRPSASTFTRPRTTAGSTRGRAKAPPSGRHQAGPCPKAPARARKRFRRCSRSLPDTPRANRRAAGASGPGCGRRRPFGPRHGRAAYGGIARPGAGDSSTTSSQSGSASFPPGTSTRPSRTRRLPAKTEKTSARFSLVQARRSGCCAEEAQGRLVELEETPVEEGRTAVVERLLQGDRRPRPGPSRPCARGWARGAGTPSHPSNPHDCR